MWEKESFLGKCLPTSLPPSCFPVAQEEPGTGAVQGFGILVALVDVKPFQGLSFPTGLGFAPG